MHHAHTQLFAVGLAGWVGCAAIAQPDFGQRKRNPQPAAAIDESEYKPVLLKTIAEKSPTLHKACVAKWIDVERAWLVEGFKAAGVHNPATDDDTIALLDRFARTYAGDPAVERGKLYADGMQHLRKTNDPLVKGLIFTLGLEQRAMPFGAEHTQVFFDEAKARDYPPARLGLLALSLAGATEREKDAMGAPGLYASAFELLAKAAAKADMTGDEQRYLAQKLIPRIDDTLSDEQAKTLADRIADNKDAPEWLRLVLAGVWQHREAWRLRGGGYVGQVTPEGWRGFEQHLAIAAKKFLAAHALAPDRPEAAAFMIKVAMAGGDPGEHSPRYWFDQAVKAQLDYGPAYDNLLCSMRPRWGGSRARILAFAQECAAVERTDTYVGVYLNKALLDVCEEDNDFQSVWEEPGIYEKCKTTLERLASSDYYTTSADAHRSVLAAIAYRTGHWDDARAALNASKYIVDKNLWNVRVSREDVERAVYPRTSPATMRIVAQADQQAQDGDFAGAVKSLDDAVTAAAGDNRLALGVAELRERLSQRADFKSGQWHPLTFSKSFPGWRHFGRNNFKLTTDTSVTCPVGPDELVLVEPVGRRWQMQGTITYPAHHLAGPLGFLHQFTWDKNEEGWVSALIDLKGRVAQMGVVNEATQTASLPAAVQVAASPAAPPTPPEQAKGKENAPPGPAAHKTPTQPDEKYELDVSAFDGDVVFKVNGKVVFAGPAPNDPDHKSDNQVGLVCEEKVGSSFSFRDLRIRRLTERPDELRDKR